MAETEDIGGKDVVIVTFKDGANVLIDPAVAREALERSNKAKTNERIIASEQPTEPHS